MKDQYFGDVNDYVKYGLLREIQRSAGLRLGVCWYLTPSDGGTDGGRRRYLTEPARWRHFDRDLFDCLGRISVDDFPPSVSHASAWELLPGAQYFTEHVPSARHARQEFLRRALSALKDAELVFVDPDNGIEPASAKRSATSTAKYVKWEELKAFFAQGASLLIYQHFPRISRETYVRTQSRAIAERLAAQSIVAFLTAHVGFFLICQEKHRDPLRRAADTVGLKWKDQIRVWTLEDNASPPS
jgi:hypothetical protein